MDHPGLVGGFQGFGDLSSDGQGVFDWYRATRDTVRQRRPLDELEGQRSERAVRSLLQAVDAPDVRVVQRGEDLGFPLEVSQAVDCSWTFATGC